MAVYICEFEAVRDDDCFVMFPVGLPGATEGYGFEDAVNMAADWLKETALDYLMREEDWPSLPLGTAPARDGRMVIIAVDTSLEQVPAMTATEAARRLDVSTARVAQLCKAGSLESWKVGGTRMVSVGSVEARLAHDKKAGRPKKESALA